MSDEKRYRFYERIEGQRAWKESGGVVYEDCFECALRQHVRGASIAKDAAWLVLCTTDGTYREMRSRSRTEVDVEEIEKDAAVSIVGP
jgi:hypothetical protein